MKDVVSCGTVFYAVQVQFVDKTLKVDHSNKEIATEQYFTVVLFLMLGGSNFVLLGDSKGPFTRQKRRNGSDRNEYRFQQNLTVYTRKFCKGTDKKWNGPQRIEERILRPFTRCFFETGTDRARNMKLQSLVHMRLRPYLKRQWMNPSY